MLQAGPVGERRFLGPVAYLVHPEFFPVNVHLPKDRISMAHQGFGFCEFLTEEDAEYACKIMNQIKLWGKPIRVNKVHHFDRGIAQTPPSIPCPFANDMSNVGFLGQEATRCWRKPLYRLPRRKCRRTPTL